MQNWNFGRMIIILISLIVVFISIPVLYNVASWVNDEVDTSEVTRWLNANDYVAYGASPGLTAGQVPYATGANSLTSESGFEYNATTDTFSVLHIDAPTGRTATYVIATGNATDLQKAQADEVASVLTPAASINAAFSHLTSGRTSKETIKVVGACNLEARILVPSYTILDLTEFRPRLNDNIDDAMLININYKTSDTDIEIIGGYFDGNNVGQGESTVIAAKYNDAALIHSEGIGSITMSNVSNLYIDGTEVVHGWYSGIEVVGCTGTLYRVHASDASDDNIAVDGDSHNMDIIDCVGHDVGVTRFAASGMANLELGNCWDITVSGGSYYQTAGIDHSTGMGLTPAIFIQRHASFAHVTHGIKIFGAKLNVYPSLGSGSTDNPVIFIDSADATNIYDVEIASCEIKTTGNATYYRSIGVKIGDVDDLKLHDNTIIFDKYGIHHSYTTNDINISGNTIRCAPGNFYGGSSSCYRVETSPIINRLTFSYNNLQDALSCGMIFIGTAQVTTAMIAHNTSSGAGMDTGLNFLSSNVLSGVQVLDNNFSGTVAPIVNGATSGVTGSGNAGYLFPGEIRTYSGSIATLTENAFNSVDNPFGQQVGVISLTIYVSTNATATSPNIDCGIGSSATTDYTTLFNDLPGETIGYYLSTVTTPGAQTVPIVWATGAGNRYLNMSIKGAAATGMVATYIVTVIGQ